MGFVLRGRTEVKGKPGTLPATGTDLAPVKAKVQDLQLRIHNYQKEAVALEIESPQTATFAVELLTKGKKAVKYIETWRLGVVEEPTRFTREVNGLAKGLKDQLDGIMGGISGKIADWNRLEEEKAAALQRELEAKAKEEQQAIDAEYTEMAEKVEDPEELPPPVRVAVPEVKVDQGQYRAVNGKVKVGSKADFELVTASEAVAELEKILQGDALTKLYKKLIKAIGPEIRAQLKQGARSFPGCSVFEKADVRVRTN